MNPEIESFLHDSDFGIVNISGLDNAFTPKEITSAIDSLKRGKIAGYDNLVPEMFIEHKSFTSPVLYSLFTFMYSKTLSNKLDKGHYYSCRPKR